MVIPGKHKIEGAAVGAHPLGGEAGRFAGADVPFLGEIDRCPRSPGLRGVVNSEASFKASVGFLTLGSRNDLDPEVAFQAGVEGDAGAVASSLVGEDRAAADDLSRPERLLLLV